MARLRLSRSGPWIAVGGLVCLLWIDLASILFAPWWGVALMLLVWLVCAVLVLGWSRIHPARTAFVPLVGLLAWAGVVALGFGAWGW
ncbi:MAG: hypothetical protein Q7T56_09255 [Nocardioidaceae bacterium]|nr:hypothetical protein [Nocardioidaceae bacterium]